jgi:hypothetical protein
MAANATVDDNLERICPEQRPQANAAISPAVTMYKQYFIILFF